MPKVKELRKMTPTEWFHLKDKVLDFIEAIDAYAIAKSKMKLTDEIIEAVFETRSALEEA